MLKSNPFKQIFNIRKNELPESLSMAGVFFLIITVFWIMKPIKKALFLGHYKEIGGLNIFNLLFDPAQTELLAKVGNMVIAFFAVWLFTILSKKYQREKLIYFFSAFCIVAMLAIASALSIPSTGLYWVFYFFGDLFSTIMVASFFVFLNDSVTPEKAKRLYGLIGFGGVLGGAFSTTILRGLQKAQIMSNEQFLVICAGLTALIALLAFCASVSFDPIERSLEDDKSQEEAKKLRSSKKSSAAIEGGKLVFNSRYLLSIALIVGLYEMASTILDFQFSSAIINLVPKEEIGAAFTNAYMSMNVVAMFTQLFLTSFIMTRFGVGAALFILPVAIFGSSAAFLAYPAAFTGSLLIVSDGGFNYSVNQSAREALYVPTSQDAKYKAKAFIDMFIQRFAKVLAVVLGLVITMIFKQFSTIPYLSFLTFTILIFWLVAVKYLGGRFEEISQGGLVDADRSAEDDKSDSDTDETLVPSS